MVACVRVSCVNSSTQRLDLLNKKKQMKFINFIAREIFQHIDYFICDICRELDEKKKKIKLTISKIKFLKILNEY